MHDRWLLSFLRRLLSKIPSLGIFLRRLLSSENSLLSSEKRLPSDIKRFPLDETYFLLCKNYDLRFFVKPRKTVVLGVRGVRGVTFFA